MNIGANLATITSKLELKNYKDSIDLNTKTVYIPDVNRPALQLNGFYEHFEANRIQLIGMVEHSYLEQIDEKARNEQ